jgi:hypothetical protein
MAAVTVITKTAADNNSFESQGQKGFVDTYAATMIPALKKGQKEQYVCVDLTGNSTINAATVLSNLSQWDKVYFLMTGTGAARTVTWGTGFLVTAATLVSGSGKDLVAEFIYDGTALREVSRSILL